MEQHLLSIPEIQITAEEILESQRTPNRPALREALDRALAMAPALWEPRAVYAWWPVERLDGETVYLAGGLPVVVGPHADLLASAREIMVAVRTIGPRLEEQARELMQVDPLVGYMLDSVGVVALGKTGEALYRMAEERARARGWGVGPSLAPGSLVGWPITGQRDLFGLVDPSPVGVRLSAECVMWPHKSVSQVIGLGPDYQKHVDSICEYCSLKSTCWRRRKKR